MDRPYLFDWGAFLYGIMTAQKTWRTSCARLARYFPALDSAQPRRILDLGCGPGVSTIILTQALPDTIVVGLDIAPRMLDAARHYTADAKLANRINYVLADAAQLPFADSTFALTTGHSFLYLVQNPLAIAREAFRVLQHGGRIVSMEPRKTRVNWRTLARHWHEIRYLISIILWRPYSRWHGQFDDARFRTLYEQAGFESVSTEVVQDGLGIIGCGERP